MYIPAKSELSGTEEIESRKDYFLQFNYIFEPDNLVGVWWQFRTKLISYEEAEAFVEWVEPLGTMDYSILNKKIREVDTKYPLGTPHPSNGLCGRGRVPYDVNRGRHISYQTVLHVGLTVKEAKGIVTRVTTKPMSCFRGIPRMTFPRGSGEDHLATQRSGDQRGQTRPPRGTGLAPCANEGHTPDCLTGREDQHQVRQIPRPTGEMPGERRAQWSYPPRFGVGSPWGSPPRLQYVRLSPTSKAPARTTEGAIGYDLYTPFSFILYPKEVKLVYIDVAIGVPVGHYGRIAPKSGLTLKHHVTVLAGVIDPDYTRNVGVVLYNLSSDTKFTSLVGEPIAQLVLEVASILPIVEVKALPISVRGPHGFGSHD